VGSVQVVLCDAQQPVQREFDKRLSWIVWLTVTSTTETGPPRSTDRS
jgi:hypothetical protein